MELAAHMPRVAMNVTGSANTKGSAKNTEVQHREWQKITLAAASTQRSNATWLYRMIKKRTSSEVRACQHDADKVVNCGGNQV